MGWGDGLGVSEEIGWDRLGLGALLRDGLGRRLNRESRAFQALVRHRQPRLSLRQIRAFEVSRVSGAVLYDYVIKISTGMHMLRLSAVLVLFTLVIFPSAAYAQLCADACEAEYTSYMDRCMATERCGDDIACAQRHWDRCVENFLDANPECMPSIYPGYQCINPFHYPETLYEECGQLYNTFLATAYPACVKECENRRNPGMPKNVVHFETQESCEDGCLRLLPGSFCDAVPECQRTPICMTMF